MSKLSLEVFRKYQKEGYTILDLRNAEDFALGFVPGSINIKMDRNFVEVAEELVVKNQYLLMLTEADKGDVYFEKVRSLGYENLLGYLDGGIDVWLNSGEKVDVVISISTEELGLEIKHGNLYLIDLRPETEFDLRHVEKSNNFDPEVMINNYDALEDDITNCIYCLDGTYSMSIVSYLKVHGKHNLYHVNGGFNAIKNDDGIKLVASEKKMESKGSIPFSN